MLIFRKIIVYIFICVLHTQNWQPFHIEELSKYQNYEFDYIEIDNRAQNLPINNQNRGILTHNVIGYLPYWEYSQYPDFNYELLSEINFFSAELSSNGNIINSHNWENLSIVEFAHNRGVKVKLCATLFGQSQLTALLSDSLNRGNAIQNLVTMVTSKNADGIDIDFELLPYSQRDNLVLFMEELSTIFHEEMEDPIITMATPAVDWSNAWDYNALAELTDGLFIMGYNYFYSGSSTAGPVSPLGDYYYDLDYTVQDYIAKTNGQLDKLILGLPYYGYDWPVINDDMNSETTGSGIARFYSDAQDMSEYYGHSFDYLSNAPWFSYNTNNWQQCWYDDSLSISTKYEYAKEIDLKGVGIWALGYDEGSTAMWGAIDEEFYSEVLGDLNDDQIVNVLDVILLVNMILDLSPLQFNSDINGDGNVDILDVIIIVNIIIEN